jgi:predicted Zn-ribbon and HTH transcriptional regulator
MMKKKTRREGRVDGEMHVRLAGELYREHTTLSPAFHPALCRECGISWNRPETRPWATMCPTCWRWNMARRHVKAAKALVEGGR